MDFPVTTLDCLCTRIFIRTHYVQVSKIGGTPNHPKFDYLLFTIPISNVDQYWQAWIGGFMLLSRKVHISWSSTWNTSKLQFLLWENIGNMVNHHQICGLPWHQPTFCGWNVDRFAKVRLIFTQCTPERDLKSNGSLWFWNMFLTLFGVVIEPLALFTIDDSKTTMAHGIPRVLQCCGDPTMRGDWNESTWLLLPDLRSGPWNVDVLYTEIRFKYYIGYTEYPVYM